MSRCDKLYVGWTSSPRGDWESYVSEPRAPSNYKARDAIERYVSDAKLRMQDEVCLVPGLGVITSIVALDDAGDPAFSCHVSGQGHGSPPALDFFKWMRATFPHWMEPDDYIGTASHEMAPLPWFFSFGIGKFFRIAALEAMLLGESVPCRCWMRVSWSAPAGMYDPYELLLSAEERKCLSVGGLLQVLGLSPSQNGDPALAGARNAWKLSSFLKLM